MRWGAGVIVASLFVTSGALAEDVETLVKQVNEEHAALSTQDCAIACKAYASIRRAADRICALEPGARCADARAKADDAQRRVQAACPDCPTAFAPPREDERRAAEPATPSSVDAKTSGTADSESAPRKGGCASCSTPGTPLTGDLGIATAGAFAIASLLRRRRRRT